MREYEPHQARTIDVRVRLEPKPAVLHLDPQTRLQQLGQSVEVRVAQLAGDVDGPSTLKEDYDLSSEEISDAVRWWDESSKYEIAA